MHDPRALLNERLAARRAAVTGWERRDARIALLRLAVFAALAAVGVAALALGRLSTFVAPPPRRRIRRARGLARPRAARARARARRAVDVPRGRRSRGIDGRWAGRGDAGERYATDDHPYARDLDLFGKGSLFELLCTARTRPGRGAARLAGSSRRPARRRCGRARARCGDLAPRLDLREDLAVLGEDVRAERPSGAAGRLGRGPAAPAARGCVAPALLLGAVALAALVGWFAGAVPGWPWSGSRSSSGSPCAPWPLRCGQVLGGVERPGRELPLLAELLGRLEREPFRTRGCERLHAALGAGGDAASHRIRALSRIVERAELGAEPVLRARGVPPPLEAAGGARGRALARRARTSVPRLARGRRRSWRRSRRTRRYAWLHPADAFPTVHDAAGGARLDGEGLGHPLLPEERVVRNDVRLGPTARLLVVSGSNMSGKSTLLRTVGANAVLALAGAPVRARRLALTPLQLGATLRIQDSLAAGTLPLLRRDHPAARAARARVAAPAVALPPRRAARRHELARPPHRRRGGAALAPRAGRGRARHHPRPRPLRDGRRASARRRTRTSRTR